MEHHVVLFSGGADSTVLLTELLKIYGSDAVMALGFTNDGKPPAAFRDIVEELFKDFGPFENTCLPLPQYGSVGFWIPGRNLLMLSAAAAWASCKFPRESVYLYLGLVQGNDEYPIRDVKDLRDGDRVSLTLLSQRTQRTFGRLAEDLEYDVPLECVYRDGNVLEFADWSAELAHEEGFIRYEGGASCISGVAWLPDDPHYPDTSLLFLSHASEAIQASTPYVGLRAPYAETSKQDVIAKGLELEAPLGLSHTCYVQEVGECGDCLACRIRMFAERYAGCLE